MKNPETSLLYINIAKIKTHSIITVLFSDVLIFCKHNTDIVLYTLHSLWEALPFFHNSPCCFWSMLEDQSSMPQTGFQMSLL